MTGYKKSISNPIATYGAQAGEASPRALPNPIDASRLLSGVEREITHE